MKEHDFSYDYLRAFAAIMIVLCHIFLGFGINREFGYYFGGTYVDVFLLLSAYLLGLSSENKGIDSPWRFLKKRCHRLVPTYYTFLTISFLLIVIFIGFNSISYKQILGHYLFLNWFWESSRIGDPPLPQIGHLWFMSCILFAYVMVIIWSQFSKRIKFLNSDRFWKIYFITFAIAATILTVRIRVAVYPCTVILAFVLLFFRGSKIISRVQQIPSEILISLLILGNIGALFFYFNNGFNYPSLIFWINLVNAFLWIASAPIVFNIRKSNRAVLFISSISFEIYLIHHPFCMGALSLKNYFPVWLSIIFVFFNAILGGVILNFLTTAVLKYSKQIFKRSN